MAAAALLFDLDGTLCDSRPWYRDVLVNGCGADAAEVESALAAGRASVILAQDLGFSRTQLLRGCSDQIAGLRLYPGVKHTLEILVKRRVPLGLVTGQSPKFVELVLDAHGLQSLFRVVVAAMLGLPAKPSPASTLRAMAALGLRAGPEVVYVGDTANDALAATRAGIGFAWAAYGYGCEMPPGTTAVVRRFPDVLEL